MKFKNEEETRKAILEGVTRLATIVKSTMGPRGKTVLLFKKGATPCATKDGVSIVRFFSLDDPFMNIGSSIVKQAAEKTEQLSGDGTTATVALTHAIIKQAQKYLAAGYAPVEMCKGINKAMESTIQCVKDHSKTISSLEEVNNIATVSANGDKVIGELISTAIDKAGKSGAIVIEESGGFETSLSLVEGFRLNSSGYISPTFITDQRLQMVKYVEPLFLVYDGKIEFVQDILPVLEKVARANRPLVVVADAVEGQALASFILNAQRNTLKICAIKSQFYGEERRNIFKDLCCVTGATLISKENDLTLDKVKLEHLGTSKSVEILKNCTTIIDGKGSVKDIEERIENLKTELQQTDNMHECERIQERITRLGSGVVIVRVGGMSEIEVVEKKHRIDDSLEACRSAMQEGILPGGGVPLLRASMHLKVEAENEDQECGIKILQNAIRVPFETIIENGHKDNPEVIRREIKDKDYTVGYDAAEGVVVDMLEKGIIDPTKVVVTALRNACSVACALIMTSHSIVED